MKIRFLFYIALFPFASLLGQNEFDTVFVKNPDSSDSFIYIKQKLDKSSLLTKKIFENENTVHISYFTFIDSIWKELNTTILKDGKLVSSKNMNENGGGLYIQYYDNGKILSISEIENSKNIGKYFEFYSDGSLMKKGRYIEYLKSGEWLFFSTIGDTIKVENYLVIKAEEIEYEKYSDKELSQMQWGGTLENELVSIKNGVFKIFKEGKLELETIFQKGKEVLKE